MKGRVQNKNKKKNKNDFIQGRSRKDEVTGLFLTNSVANVIKRVDKVTTNTPVWPIRITTSTVTVH